MGRIFRKYKKDEIAARMLETALDLHFEGKDGFSVVQLAAAAEEVLAGFLKTKKNEKESGSVSIARERTISALKEIYAMHGVERTVERIGKELNFLRNKTKHYDASSDPTEISTCLELEVESALFRAVENYVMHFGNLTEKMSRFINIRGSAQYWKA
jgi:hypothetical protein